MATQITKSRRCVIIAGAPDEDVDFIRQAVRQDDFVLCADRGVLYALDAGITPDVIVGDFDSYSGDLPSGSEVVRLLPEKDDTDTLHCVDTALKRGYTEFILLAATGGRLDHTLANVTVLEYLDAHNAHGMILSKNETIRFLPPGTHFFHGLNGKTFSVFPFGCDSAVLSYRGAKYPLHHEPLCHSTARGVSNVFTSGAAEITVHSGKAVVIVVSE